MEHRPQARIGELFDAVPVRMQQLVADFKAGRVGLDAAAPMVSSVAQLCAAMHASSCHLRTEALLEGICSSLTDLHNAANILAAASVKPDTQTWALESLRDVIAHLKTLKASWSAEAELPGPTPLPASPQRQSAPEHIAVWTARLELIWRTLSTTARDPLVPHELHEAVCVALRDAVSSQLVAGLDLRAPFVRVRRALSDCEARWVETRPLSHPARVPMIEAALADLRFCADVGTLFAAVSSHRGQRCLDHYHLLAIARMGMTLASLSLFSN